MNPKDLENIQTADEGSRFYELPLEMLRAKRWLVWRSETHPADPEKKRRKVPYYVTGGRRTGELDSPADREGLANFADAERVLQTGSFTGLGFALGPDGTGNVWQGIDLDDIPNRPALGFIADDLPGYTEDSPSGKGKHAIGYGRPFAALGSNTTGIEAYARGRFFTVTAVGAGIHPPVCLADFVEQRLKPMHGSRSDAPTRNSAGEPAAIENMLPPQTIKDLRSALLYLRADDRDLWVRLGHALKTIGNQGRGLFMEWSATSLEKFDPADAADKWDSFKPTKIGYQAVFAEAQRAGWLNPASNVAPLDISDYSEAVRGEAGQGAENAPQVAIDPVESLAENIIGLDSLATMPDCFLPHFVDMWIPQDEVTLLAGHGGGGKSYVALSLAVHVALGLPFGTLETTQAKVLFFSGEDGAPVLRQRLGRLCRALKIDPMQLDGRLHLLDASDIDPALHREQKVVIGGRQQVITETILLDALSALVVKLDVGLVVVDNASDAFDDDEIRRARVRGFIRSLRSRLARSGRAVLLLAHINKASANGGRAAGNEDYSGSTAWHNSVRSRLSLTPDGDDALKVEHMKANLGMKAGSVRLEWSEGVPLVAGSYTNVGAEAAKNIARAVEQERDAVDKAALVALVQDFDKRGEPVTTSFHGPVTVFKQLRTHPQFPSGIGSDKLARLLRALEAEGNIYRVLVKTPDRKKKFVFTCNPAVPESAPNATADPAPCDTDQQEGALNG